MQSNFCSAILNSHCCKPVSSPCQIDRAEIYRILNEKAGVFAVCAPAGYGKTSLLSGWAEQTNAKICWLSLDFDANNYHRFWTYMITAFSLAYKKYPTEQLLRELNEKTSQEFIIAFLNSLASNTVIILDDFHYIHDIKVISSVQTLCSELPADSKLVISSRGKLPFSFAKLYAQQRFHSISKESLKFSVLEIAEAARAENIRIKTDEVGTLWQRTSGWPVAVQLYLLLLKEHGKTNLALLPDPERIINDYIVEELLSSINADSQKLLLYSSVLPYMTPRLCEGIYKIVGIVPPDIPSTLNSLWSQSMFLERREDGSYRCHPLLRRHLKKILKSGNSQLYSRLCKAAENHFLDTGDVLYAIDTAIAAEDWDSAADLIEKNYSNICADGSTALLSKWLDAIPPEKYAALPKLHIARAWTHMSAGKTDECQRELDLAENIYATRSDDSCACEIAALRALNYSLVCSDYNDGLKYSQEAQHLYVMSKSHTDVENAELALGISRFLGSDPSGAETTLQKILGLPQSRQNVFFSFFVKYYIAVLEQKRGRLRRAADLLSEAIRMSTDADGKERPFASVAHISLARIFYEWNRPEECMQEVRLGLELQNGWSTPLSMMSGYNILAQVSNLMGNGKLASAAARYSYESAGGSYATPFITHEAVSSLRIKATNSNMNDSLLWADRYLYQIRKSNEIRGTALWEAPAALHLAIAGGDAGNIGGLLDAMVRVSEGIGYYQQLIETQILRALIFSENGETHKAMLALANALEHSQREGYTRIFLDEGEPMKQLLEEAKHNGITSAYTERLIDAFPHADAQDNSNDFLLSAREVEVLKMLSAGSSPKQIAKALFISIGTTRSHLHHIYEKLGVENQLQAIQSAREKKIIL